MTGLIITRTKYIFFLKTVIWAGNGSTGSPLLVKELTSTFPGLLEGKGDRGGGDKGPGAPTNQAILKEIGYVRVLWKPPNDRGDTETLTWQSLELFPCLLSLLQGSEMA